MTIGGLVDKNRYELHPDLVTMFQSSTNNTDNETILARNYLKDEVTNFINILGFTWGHWSSRWADGHHLLHLET